MLFWSEVYNTNILQKIKIRALSTFLEREGVSKTHYGHSFTYIKLNGNRTCEFIPAHCNNEGIMGIFTATFYSGSYNLEEIIDLILSKVKLNRTSFNLCIFNKKHRSLPHSHYLKNIRNKKKYRLFLCDGGLRMQWSHLSICECNLPWLSLTPLTIVSILYGKTTIRQVSPKNRNLSSTELRVTIATLLLHHHC